jgi:hypothetical protein
MLGHFLCSKNLTFFPHSSHSILCALISSFELCYSEQIMANNLKTRHGLFFSMHGIALFLTCPYTLQQNGWAERVLRTVNDSLRSLLFPASVQCSFWPDVLAASMHVLNRRPCRLRANSTPFELLFGMPLGCDHLQFFCCLCSPNTAATPYKLAPIRHAASFSAIQVATSVTIQSPSTC